MKKIKFLFKDAYWLLMVFITPSCWIQNHPYSKNWDKRLRQLMSVRNFIPIDQWTAKIAGLVIWTGNHPYASFSPYNHALKIRPSRMTILMAHEKLINDFFINKMDLRKRG